MFRKYVSATMKELSPFENGPVNQRPGQVSTVILICFNAVMNEWQNLV